MMEIFLIAALIVFCAVVSAIVYSYFKKELE